MTTIAYCDGILAADTRMMRGDTIDPAHMQKISRDKSGRLFAITGDLAEGANMVAWLSGKRNGERPILSDDARVIEISTRDRIVIYETKGTFSYRCKANAWGSGCQAALVAMDYGASAKDAVRIAMKYDPGTGGRIRVLALKPKRKEK